MEVGNLELPTVRGLGSERPWASLSEIRDWVDEKYRIISGKWLARACGIPVLRRGLGPRRIETLREFIDQTEYSLDAGAAVVAEWAPLLAADLATPRRKATKRDWENFYADLGSLPSALPHMRGKAIFRLADGGLGAANSPDTLGERELYISTDPENATRQRKRVAGTTMFPPKSVAQRMLFADPF